MPHKKWSNSWEWNRHEFSTLQPLCPQCWCRTIFQSYVFPLQLSLRKGLDIMHWSTQHNNNKMDSSKLMRKLTKILFDNSLSHSARWDIPLDQVEYPRIHQMDGTSHSGMSQNPTTSCGDIPGSTKWVGYLILLGGDIPLYQVGHPRTQQLPAGDIPGIGGLCGSADAALLGETGLGGTCSFP